MLYAIISDLHGNKEALKRVIEDARAKGVEKFICLGDVVGYGPLPDETATLARSTCAVTVAGNHDDAVTGRINAKDFIDLAGDAVERHRQALSQENLAWLKSLQYVHKEADFVAVHGDVVEPEKFYYIDDENDAAANFNATDAQLMFVGHTHCPGLFLVGNSGNVYKLEPTDFTLEGGKRYIVNPGSVGYPRESNGYCQSSYVIYDSDQKAVTFHFLPFSVGSVMQRGAMPRQTKKRLVFAIAAIASIVVGTLAYLLAPKTEVAEDERLIIKKMILPIKENDKSFSANLVLDTMSDKVILHYRQLSADGQLLKDESITVVKSSKKQFKIMKGSATVELKLLKANLDDKPRIERFSPSVIMDE
jgi:predicted phosphodiesterase